MPEKTTFRCSDFSRQKKFTSDSWPLKHINIHNPEHLQVTNQQNLTILRGPQHVEPGQHHEIGTKKHSVEDFDAFSYIEHAENNTDF
jgi:hypothetical protein